MSIVQTSSANHPYSTALRSGSIVSVSGRLGLTASGELRAGGFAAECRQAFENLDRALRGVDASRADVIHVIAYLVRREDRDELNAVYRDFFADPRPTRSCVGVAWLPYGGVVEIEATAHVRDPGVLVTNCV